MAKKNGRANRNRHFRASKNAQKFRSKIFHIDTIEYEDANDDLTSDSANLSVIHNLPPLKVNSTHNLSMEVPCDDIQSESSNSSSSNRRSFDLNNTIGNDDSSVNVGDFEEMPFEQDEVQSIVDYSIPRGILNHGNTCFINASLQALFAIPPMRQYFTTCYFRRLREQTNTNLIDHLERFFHHKFEQQSFEGEVVSKAISIPLVNHIWGDLKLRRFQQQDAQEFLKYLFNYIHEELKYIDTFVEDSDSCPLIFRERLLFEQSQNLVRLKQKYDRRYSESLHQFYTLSLNQNLSNLIASNSKSIQPPLKYRSIVSDIFSGKLKNIVHCLSCGNSSSRSETFQDLSIPISILVKSNSPNSSEKTKLSGKKTFITTLYQFLRTGNFLNVFEWFLAYIAFFLVLFEYSLTLINSGNYRLEDCLSRYFSQEVLTDDNKYQCDKCKQLTDCVKQLKIQSLPDILTVHLNRYQNSYGNIQKLTSCIEFPLTGLDTSQFLSDDCLTDSSLYDLVAVIAHYGIFMNSGHYVCYALNDNNQEWFLYDDHRVSRISTESLIDEMSSVAYILFYRKSACLYDTLDSNENISFTQAAREVCLDLEEIYCRMNEDTHKKFDLFRHSMTMNNNKFFLERFNSSSITVNREAVYLSRYWLNLFVNTEHPGLFNNYEAFCPHGNVRQTEWLYFNKIVTKVVKPVGMLLYSIYGDIFCPCVIPSSSKTAVCQECLAILLKLEISCQQKNEQLENFERNKEVLGFYRFFNGTIEMSVDTSIAGNNIQNEYSNGHVPHMGGDLISLDDHMDNNANVVGKFYVISYDWYISLQNFTYFQQFGKVNCSTDYRQMLAQIQQACCDTTFQQSERLSPFPVINNGSNNIKLSFLPLKALMKVGERLSNDGASLPNDKVRNDMVKKILLSSYINQIDFNIHAIMEPSQIDNWNVFGIKNKIFDYLEKNKQDLPECDDSEESLNQLGKLIQKALNDDAFGYHFDATPTFKQPFENEFNFYVVIISENVWKFFKESFGFTLEIYGLNNLSESQSFYLKLDQKSLGWFYKLYFKPWMIEQSRM